jgi:phenylpropionate dioxygenase-like ring-hydroxylating dioxygenase large terminal subunit
MSTEAVTIRPLRNPRKVGVPLAPWAYLNPEVFDLEYDAFFLRRWQFVGHVNEVSQPGDFMTADIGHDNVVVLRGKDGVLRAFLNVCRHRASRVFEGKGHCRGVARCPYHGWTYRLDGSLMAIPREENFEAFDRSEFGLHAIELEDFHGLLFVRVKGDGPSVAEQFAHTAEFFEMYDVASYEPIVEEVLQVWEVNWKVAWDNYLENYHIPIGHPGLHRLIERTGEGEELTGGLSYGVFRIRDRLSHVDVERRYQQRLPASFARLPAALHGRWVQFGLSGNLGIDLYPEMLDIFQLIPLGHDRTLVRAAFYGHPEPTPTEQELRRLNLEINNAVNDEDRTLCLRVQQGLRTAGYRPGPLSAQESGVYRFHELVRTLVPVTALDTAPPRGQVAAENTRLLA